MKSTKYVVIPAFILSLTACLPRTEQSAVKDGGGTSTVAGQSTNPLYNTQDNWPDTCKTGTRQSPIALYTSHVAQVARSANLKYDFAPVDTKVVDDGHSVKAIVANGKSSLTLDTVDFDLLQFHFHETSEHSLNDQMYNGELHFVHKERNGNGLVALGLFLIESATAQSGLEDFFTKLPAGQQNAQGHSGHGESELLPSTQVDPSTIIKTGLNYIVYNGSLTTPPCTETVTHMVATEPLPVTPQTLAKLRTYHAKTNRKIQNLFSDEIRDFRTTRR
jgi:carbonic anhydrase